MAQSPRIDRRLFVGGAAALLAPVAIYLFQFVALNSMFKTLTGRKSVWKGREV